MGDGLFLAIIQNFYPKICFQFSGIALISATFLNFSEGKGRDFLHLLSEKSIAKSGKPEYILGQELKHLMLFPKMLLLMTVLTDFII